MLDAGAAKHTQKGFISAISEPSANKFQRETISVITVLWVSVLGLLECRQGLHSPCLPLHHWAEE